MRQRALFLFTILGILLALPGFSQAQNLDSSLSVTLNEINRANPKSNPHYTRATRIVNRHLLDNKNKIVGDVQDLVITQEGEIVSLRSDLDRIRIGGPDLFLGYEELNMHPAENGYVLGMDDGDLKEIYPGLLADIATAAGESAGILSIDSLIGADVTSRDGRRIGKIEDVLFNHLASRAEAVMVRVNYRNVRGRSVALPLSVPEFRSTGGRPDVILTSAQADTVLEFADY